MSGQSYSSVRQQDQVRFRFFCQWSHFLVGEHRCVVRVAASAVAAPAVGRVAASADARVAASRVTRAAASAVSRPLPADNVLVVRVTFRGNSSGYLLIISKDINIID